jgi:hypothetical protein
MGVRVPPFAPLDSASPRGEASLVAAEPSGALSEHSESKGEIGVAAHAEACALQPPRDTEKNWSSLCLYAFVACP